MESAFPRDADSYVVVQTSEDEILQTTIDACVANGWTKLARLYGVQRVAGGYTPVRCGLPVGYGTIKYKSWRAEVVKGRPISPHTKHPMKHISNTNARGYHVMLLSVRTERVTRMYTTQEYKGRLAADQQRVRMELRRLTGDASAQPAYVYDM
jgi:hypothetical protein